MHKEDGARLTSEVHSHGIRCTGHMFQTWKFYLNMRTNFFALRVTEHWNRMSREAVKSPLEIFKTQLDLILCTACFIREVGLDDVQRSYQPQSFCESVIL